MANREEQECRVHRDAFAATPAFDRGVQVSGNEEVGNDNSHNYATDDFVRDLRNYT